ncbi:MAG TPA: hypothetical protein VGA13_06285 [Acidimicrobiales bacterium]|jgi:hypothetical protein
MGTTIVRLDPLLGAEGAERMLAGLRAYGSYGQYSNEGFDTGYAPELPQRFDAALNFIRTGGRLGSNDDVRRAAARTNYVRETYAYGDDVFLAGIEELRDHEALRSAAVAVHDRPLIEPAIVYANVLLPGQELATHTDVPEFRGANRTTTPQWLLVVMAHSGLFETWRMPIATAIAYFGGGDGGALHLYPDGADGPVDTVATAHDTAVVLDTDSIFHGVDRVDGDDSWLDSASIGDRLHPADGGGWQLRGDGGEVRGRFGAETLRFSVSWKAYCFADHADRDRWHHHRDDLGLDQILDTLEDDLRRRQDLDGDRPKPVDFGRLLVDTYIRFPVPTT